MHPPLPRRAPRCVRAIALRGVAKARAAGTTGGGRVGGLCPPRFPPPPRAASAWRRRVVGRRCVAENPIGLRLLIRPWPYTWHKDATQPCRILSGNSLACRTTGMSRLDGARCEGKKSAMICYSVLFVFASRFVLNTKKNYTVLNDMPKATVQPRIHVTETSFKQYLSITNTRCWANFSGPRALRLYDIRAFAKIHAQRNRRFPAFSPRPAHCDSLTFVKRVKIARGTLRGRYMFCRDNLACAQKNKSLAAHRSADPPRGQSEGSQTPPAVRQKKDPQRREFPHFRSVRPAAVARCAAGSSNTSPPR